MLLLALVGLTTCARIGVQLHEEGPDDENGGRQAWLDEGDDGWRPGPDEGDGGRQPGSDVDANLLEMVRGAAIQLTGQAHNTLSKFAPEIVRLHQQMKGLAREDFKTRYRALPKDQQLALRDYIKHLKEQEDSTERTSSRPEVAFDEFWFEDNCKIGADPTASTVYYQNEPWRPFKKCEVRDGTDERPTEFVGGTKELCDSQCSQVADQDPHSTFCCEWDGNGDGKCSVTKSFLSMADSSKGSWFNRLVNSQSKFAKFVKSKRRRQGTGNEGDAEESEFEDIKESQKFVQRLVEQVNHMSIDGILKHLLSFYTCMRWVPDSQFVEVAKFEMANIDIDASTRRTEGPMTDEDAIEAYINFDAVPIKCSSGMEVQDVGMIDVLLKELKDPNSNIGEAYHFAQEVAGKTEWLGLQKWFGKTSAVTERMENKVEVEEMAAKARTILPWDGFVRPSQQFTWGMGSKWGTHVSKAKNLFFICFGPRVSSFPHKRENGGHFMADMNMAGCNGLWSLEEALAHIARIRQLFAPETCLTDDLRRKLKTVMLETFVEMNEGFEKKLTGKMFTDKIDGVATIPKELTEKSSIPLEWVDQNSVEFVPESKVTKKYQRTGRLVSGAHTKWLVCEAKNKQSPAQGFASAFFSSPDAYSKWFDAGSSLDNTKPECKTYDPLTGCLKCVIAVRSHPWRCLQRLGLDFQQIFKAVDRKAPPLSSKYDTVELVQEGNMTGEKRLKTESGVCMAAKDERDRERLVDRDRFRVVGQNDRIVLVKRSGVRDKGFAMVDRYGLPDRRSALAEFISKGGVEETPLSDEEKLEKAVRDSLFAGQETHVPEENFGPRLTFSEVVPEENNVPAHEVDYFLSCPCETKDFSKIAHHESTATNRMSEYLLGNGVAP